MDSNQTFSSLVLNWFDIHGRKHLPWQQNITPYRVLVSEIMLQQTQVTTVVPYFEQFIARYPDVQILAAAHQDDVLHLWSGLGYYSRARNLHKAAQYISKKYKGIFPTSVESLVELPGVGRSTAGAIASISMGIRAPILDGNVKRVLTRHHTIKGWPGTTTVANLLWSIAEELTPLNRTAEYSQAMMDLGSLICTRSKPICTSCPLETSCLARATASETQYPQSKPKKQLPTRPVHMVMVINPLGEILLEKRPSNGIWGGLWSFPEIDSVHQLKHEASKKVGLCLDNFEEWAPFRHTFSHFHLNITPVKICTDQESLITQEKKDWHWYQPNQPSRLGIAAPVKKLLAKLKQDL